MREEVDVMPVGQHQRLESRQQSVSGGHHFEILILLRGNDARRSPEEVRIGREEGQRAECQFPTAQRGASGRLVGSPRRQPQSDVGKRPENVPHGHVRQCKSRESDDHEAREEAENRDAGDGEEAHAKHPRRCLLDEHPAQARDDEECRVDDQRSRNRWKPAGEPQAWMESAEEQVDDRGDCDEGPGWKRGSRSCALQNRA